MFRLQYNRNQESTWKHQTNKQFFNKKSAQSQKLKKDLARLGSEPELTPTVMVEETTK